MQDRMPSYDLTVAEALDARPRPQVRRLRCRASMVLANPGNERVVIRTAKVRDLDGLRTELGESFQLRVAGVVPPFASSRLPIGFDVPSTARPGHYRFEVTIGELTETMSIDVLARPGLRVTPSVLIVTEPGTSAHRITVENSGNVAVSVSGTIAVPLDDELIVCRSLRGGLALFDECEEVDVTADRLLARAARTAHDALAGAVLAISFSSDIDPIPPGATAYVDVEIKAPTSLDPRNRYVGVVPILTTTLGIVVVSTKVASVVGATDASRSEGVGPSGQPATGEGHDAAPTG